MSKSEINLLPPSVLTERIRRIYLQRAGRLYGVLVVGVILLLMVYGGIGWMLWSLNEQLERRQIDSSQDTKTIQGQVRSINILLAAMRQHTDRHLPWMGQVQEALLLVPDGVVVQEVELKEIAGATGKKQKLIEISGESSSRSAVVEYEKALNDLSWVGQVESPLKNLASGETVAFSFSLRRAELDKKGAGL